MAEDLLANLRSYKLQYQQVESALELDPENEDLLKLEKDLKEVLDLTEELINSQSGATAVAAVASSSSSSGYTPASAPDEPTSKSEQTRTEVKKASRTWKVGDKCMAIYSEDQGTYEATIEEILDDGTCTVTFHDYGNTDITQVSLLMAVEQGRKREATDDPNPFKPTTKRDKMAAEREYKRKKSQKKAQRLKQLEEERESEKNKWLDFNAKTFSKTTKGKVKKSIFATPDSASGRVGVGTCGKSGNPMTKFAQHEKWKK